MFAMGAKSLLRYDVSARRMDAHGSTAELLLAALAACMIKGIERVVPILKFQLDGVRVSLHGERQDSPPKMVNITYQIVVDTSEPDRRLDLLHENVRKYGTIYNTIAGATNLSGTIRRLRAGE